MTITHAARMAGKKANRAALEPGCDEVLPSLNNATGFNSASRRHRRATIARAQASQRDPNTGEITKPRLKTHAAKVQYQRGVQKLGVCPTQPRPCDQEDTDGAS